MYIRYIIKYRFPYKCGAHEIDRTSRKETFMNVMEYKLLLLSLLFQNIMYKDTFIYVYILYV